ASVELSICACSGIPIELLDCFFQHNAVYLQTRGESADRLGSDEIASFDELAMKSRSRTHKTEPVRIQRSSIGNQKEPLHTALLLRHHCLNKTMIRIRFIDETLAAVADGNDTGLARSVTICGNTTISPLRALS